jgi:hypothetical protein
MQLIFIAMTIGACLTSALLYFFLKRGALSVISSIVAPIALLAVYCLLLARDEFGFSFLVLILGTCYCLLGSILGVFTVHRFFKINRA